MGTFAGLWEFPGADIPAAERESACQDLTELFWRGGMFTLLFMRHDEELLRTIQRPELDDGEFDVTYNYFDDSRWENAGVEVGKDGMPYVYSNKIGDCFEEVINAAYSFECVLLDRPALPAINAEVSVDFTTMGWLQWLFPKRKIPTPLNLMWAFYVALYKGAKDTEEDRTAFWQVEQEAFAWADRADDPRSFVSAGEIVCVHWGVDWWLYKFCRIPKPESTDDTGRAQCWEIAQLYRRCADAVEAYKEMASLPEEEQFSALQSAWFEAAADAAGRNEAGSGDKTERTARQFASTAAELGAPVFVCKLLCTAYHRDFWDTWKHMPDSIRRPEMSYMQPGRDGDEVSTQKMFDVTDDDMIPWWTPGCDLQFSPTLKARLQLFADRFEAALRHPRPLKNAEDHYYTLLQEANARYYRIYAFDDFVEESTRDPDAPHIRAMWDVFEKLIYDPELYAAAGVIFRDPEQRREEPFGPLVLKTYWEFLPREETRNEGRTTVKQYLALVGNKALRQEVLGV